MRRHFSISSGFVWLPLLLAVLAILAVSGGAYYVMHQNAASAVPIYQEATTNPKTAPATGNATPSATIDQSSLTTTSINPTISGSATNIDKVDVAVIYSAPAKSFGSVNVGKSDVPVVNGRWFTTLSSPIYPGTYSVQVGVYNTAYQYSFETLAKGSLVVTAPHTNAPLSVPGMSQYTDGDFGFSVWMPSTWPMTKTTSTNMLNASGYQGGTLSAAWDFSGSDAGVAGRIDEYYSPNSSVTILGKPLGYNYDYTLYFNAPAHTWMQTQNGLTTAADVSNNTMGGLHIIKIFGEEIVPLSAHNFLIIHSEGSDYLDGIVMTILATDPSVAVPVDIGTQTQTVQAEYNNYVIAPAKCNNLGDVGALTMENCRQNAVRGQ